MLVERFFLLRTCSCETQCCNENSSINVLGESTFVPSLCFCIFEISQSSKWYTVYKQKRYRIAENFSREKTFANFAVLWLYTKVFSVKFGAWRPLAQQK